MKLLSSYFRLIRLNQPVGIFLLLWPCWWSLAFAWHGLPPFELLLLFATGAVIMRGAGCIINDMADREFDKNVERTRSRPLASGEITAGQAVAFLLLLLAMALVIVLRMNKFVVVIAAVSLIFVVAYPFMKRITWWPQAFLGITFNWGALMGWAAVKGNIGIADIFLYIGCIFWTLGYDTIYAHQDKDDDVRIGVKSTALRLSGQSGKWIAVFYLAALALWIIAGMLAGNRGIYYLGLLMVAAHFAWQVHKLDIDNPANCLKVFRSNSILGLVMFMSIIL